MNNRERVLCALNFEKPDYTPYQIQFTQQMLEKMNAYKGCEDYRRLINQHMASTELIKSQVEIKPGYFMDEYGIVWNKTGADKDIGVVDSYLLEDLSKLQSLEFPEVDEAFIRSRMEALLADSGEHFTAAAIGFSMFERAWTLRGMENLLCDMITEPEFVHELMNRILQRNLKILDIALEYPIDGFYFGDDWGQQRGLIMGPKHWRTFIKPYVAQMYAKVHKKGLYVIQHSCGDIRDIMDELSEIGLNVYQTFQPEIYGLDYAKKIQGRVSILGGMSTQRDLPTKTAGEVARIARELLDAFPQGGLIAAPTHDIPGDVPPENVEAMHMVFAQSERRTNR